MDQMKSGMGLPDVIASLCSVVPRQILNNARWSLIHCTMQLLSTAQLCNFDCHTALISRHEQALVYFNIQ